MVIYEEYRYKDGNHRELKTPGPNRFAELEKFYNRLCVISEPLTPQTVMKIFIHTFGGLRISIPALKYLERIERDKSIRNAFHGGNYRELAIRFGLTENSIRRIVHS